MDAPVPQTLQQGGISYPLEPNVTMILITEAKSRASDAVQFARAIKPVRPDVKILVSSGKLRRASEELLVNWTRRQKVSAATVVCAACSLFHVLAPPTPPWLLSAWQRTEKSTPLMLRNLRPASSFASGGTLARTTRIAARPACWRLPPW